MNNWCIYWFFTHIFTEDFIFKGLTLRRLFKSFGVKGLISRQVYSPPSSLLLRLYLLETITKIRFLPGEFET
jgi:hypothetical protein